MLPVSSSLALLICVLLFSRVDAFQPHSSCSTTPRISRISRSRLHSEKPPSKPSGVYTRPSAAIERGSGFFVPGLEGPRVRLLGGSVLVGLVALNRLSSSYTSAGLTLAHGLALGFGLLVLWQAALEATKEASPLIIGTSSSKDATAKAEVQAWQQRWTVPVQDAGYRDGVQWVAQTLLSLTAATEFVLIVGTSSPNTDDATVVVYSLGTSENLRTGDANAAASAALTAVAASASGRIALPTTHPAAAWMGTRTTLGQRVDSQTGILIGSPQVLEGFAPNDLRWLGQLAQYLARMSPPSS